MGKFRKKPVVIEAMQWKYCTPELEEWIGDSLVSEEREGIGVMGYWIKTLEGNMMISTGDWIIKGVNGEFYPCKPDIFEKTYEAEEFSIDKTFEEFWKGIVYDEQGNLNLDQIKKELHDYHYMLEQVPKVYCAITNSTLSYPNYPAETVISVYEACLNEVVEQEVKEIVNNPISNDSLIPIQSLINNLDSEKREQVSDGYHTFKELYDHRIRLWIEYCKLFEFSGCIQRHGLHSWITTVHSDGSSWDGWFLLGLGTEKGQQMTYHLPMPYWMECTKFANIIDKAPEFDGHTSADVLERLKELI